MLAQLVIKLKRVESSRAELATSRASSRATSILPNPKYDLLGHINGMVAARPADPLWSQPDACVRGWMYNSADDAVLDLAMEPDQDARALYVSIEALFQANKESHVVVLEQEFHNLSQGDLFHRRLRLAAEAHR
jgi:hypothetical protein